MKLTKSLNQKHLALLSLLALLVLGALFTFGYKKFNQETDIPKASADRQALKAERALLEAAENAVEELENKQTKDNLDKAQAAVDALVLTNQSTKSNLQDRITKIAKIIKDNQILAAAEKALSTLEANPTLENLEAAQKSIDQVSNQGTRTLLQTRLSAVQIQEPVSGFIEESLDVAEESADLLEEAGGASDSLEQTAPTIQMRPLDPVSSNQPSNPVTEATESINTTLVEPVTEPSTNLDTQPTTDPSTPLDEHSSPGQDEP